MLLLVSGEGQTDIGAWADGSGQCAGADFRPGPMAVIIDRLVEQVAGYSLLDSAAMEFISECTLKVRSKRLPVVLSAGKRRDYETALFFKNARALAQLAKAKVSPTAPVGAILFRDADGTRSTERGLFEQKWKSIEDGFRAEGFGLGVPMVPKPKSEAWLLCALKSQPYQHCAGLEDSLSGNDRAPSPAKAQLASVLSARGKTVGDLVAMLGDGSIAPNRIDMPSFNRFRDRPETVARSMLRRPSPTPGANLDAQ